MVAFLSVKCWGSLSEDIYARLLSAIIINTVSIRYMPMGWILSWAGHCMVFPTVSASFILSAILFDRNISGSIIEDRWFVLSLNWFCVYILEMVVQILFLHCWAFQIKSSPLSSGSFLHLWFLGISEGLPSAPSPQLHTSIHFPCILGFDPVFSST